MKNATIESITSQSEQEEQIIVFEDEGAQEIMQSPNQTAKLDNQMLQANTENVKGINLLLVKMIKPLQLKWFCFLLHKMNI